MDNCSRCNWSGPAGRATCPRCGQLLSSAAIAPTIVQTAARPVLVLKLLGGELPPAEWEIEGAPVGIGRLDDSEVTLPHRSVSRHHARIVPTANGYEVEDLGSTNGTWLNDRRLNDRAALADGDSLMVGDIPLVVELIQPQRQAQAEILDVPQLPVGPRAPERAPETPAGGASTVFYELDAALAAARPAEPAPPFQPAPPPQPAQPPADYQRSPPLQPAQPPAGYRRTAPQAPQTPAVPPPPPDVEVPRARDDTPSTRLDLSSADDLAANDEHPTLIAQVPVEQFQPPAEVVSRPQPLPQREPPPTGPQPSPRGPSSTGTPTAPREPLSAGLQPSQRDSQSPRDLPAPVQSGQPAPSLLPGGGLPDLSAASMIDLAEHLASALRLLKGDIALAMWLFEHAGGPPAAQEFVERVQRLQADPHDPHDLANLVESAPTAARLLEAAILLVNVLSSLDPPGGVDNQLESDAADLQPIARS